MARRNERPLLEEKNRRSTDRRNADRRKSDRLKRLLKYLAVAILTALAMEAFRH